MWYVYIIECANNALYTGITTDLKRRFSEHASGRGGRYTKMHRGKKLLYSEEYTTRSEALKRESMIKTWPRKRKLNLVSKYYL